MSPDLIFSHHLVMNPHTTSSADLKSEGGLEGFTVVLSPEGQKYFIPDYLVPEIKFRLQAESNRKNFGVYQNADQVIFVLLFDACACR